MSSFPIVIDVFEGSGLLDLHVLKSNNVKYVLVRLGCYSRLGGLMGNRKDDLFDAQWNLLNSDNYFKKGIYIPYNPWKGWQYNLQWLLDNIPSDCKTVELDVENLRTYMYTPNTYAAEFSEYLKRIPSDINVIIYTGEGYLPIMAYWPKDKNYSWAQYYSSLRPSDSVNWTWDYFRQKLSIYSGPSNASKCPGPIKMWQVTGDKVIVPGSNKGMDIYGWLGTQDELDKFFNSDSIIDPPPPTPTGLKVRVKSGNNLNLRDKPTTIGSTVLLSEKSLSILTSLESDIDTINKVNKSGEWLNVIDSNSNKGFVSSIFLELVNDIPNPPPPNVENIDGIVNQGYINVRTGAGTNYGISVTVPSVKLNQKLSLISPFSHDVSGNVWAKINDDGNNWVCLRYNNVWYVNLIDGFMSFVVPSDGEFVQTNHDYQGEEYQHTPRSIVIRTRMSLPETINLIGAKKINDFYPLNKEWQEFIFQLLVKANNGVKTDKEMLNAWLDFTLDKRCFTDKNSWSNGFREYIVGKNPLAKRDMAWKSLSTGGNLLKVLSKDGNRLTVEALDISKSPPKLEDVWGKNHLIHWATQETIIKLSDGTYRVVSFPQLSPYFGTPFPVLGVDGYNIVTTDLVHDVENGKVYNIYNNV